MISNTRYPSVIFDLDGTLVDSYAALAEALNHVRASEGKTPLSIDRIKTYVGEGVEVLLQRAFEGERVDDRVKTMFEEHYDQICCERSILLDEVADTLTELRAGGIHMAVCTNKPTAFSVKILEHLDIARYFRAIVGPEADGVRKPDRRHVIKALDAVGGLPNLCLFVGDMPIDVEAARNSGLDIAVIATGSSSADALREAQPDYFLGRFSELTSVVFGHTAENSPRQDTSSGP